MKDARQPPAASYTARDIERALGIPRMDIEPLIAALAAAGLIALAPDAADAADARSARNARRFTFQDLMLLRTAHALRVAKVPPRKIVGALTTLKNALPDALPLSGLRITATGAAVTVRERGRQWEVDSGQWLLDFEVARVGGSIMTFAAAMPSSAPTAPGADASDARAAFEHGAAIEPDDSAAAEAAYRHAIALDPCLHDAYANLGALLCEAGRCGEAVELFEAALAHCGNVALIHFNRAVALEDIGDDEAARAAYERCLELDRGFADAHWNLAVLHQRGGDERRALRHFNAFRRIEQEPGAAPRQ